MSRSVSFSGCIFGLFFGMGLAHASLINLDSTAGGWTNELPQISSRLIEVLHQSGVNLNTSDNIPLSSLELEHLHCTYQIQDISEPSSKVTQRFSGFRCEAEKNGKLMDLSAAYPLSALLVEVEIKSQGFVGLTVCALGTCDIRASRILCRQSLDPAGMPDGEPKCTIIDGV